MNIARVGGGWLQQRPDRRETCVGHCASGWTLHFRRCAALSRPVRLVRRLTALRFVYHLDDSISQKISDAVVFKWELKRGDSPFLLLILR